jgi:glycine cleavage system H protein
MSEVPTDLRYAKSHEWAKDNGDGTVTIGITDHAQDQLGDLVYVETPEVGSTYQPGDACAVVESVKAASDIYAPIAGEVTAVNEGLGDSPEKINQDPYGEGWILKLQITDAAQLDGMMDASAYSAHVEAEEH